MVSAPFFDRVRGDMNPSVAYVGADGIPTISLGTLQIERVDIPELFE
jgi:hypothetical protein